MENGDKKRDIKRSKNFKDMEVECLLNLVKEHKSVIENKKTDQVTFQEKESAWKEIEKKFNAHCGMCYRDSKTLRNKYENLKKTSKRKWAEEKKYIIGTGGGPYKPSEISNVDIKIKDLMGDVQVCGETPKFDCDSFVEDEIANDTEQTFFEEVSSFDLSAIPVITKEELSECIIDHNNITNKPKPPQHNINLSSRTETLLEQCRRSYTPNVPSLTSSGSFDVKRSPPKTFPMPSTPSVSNLQSQTTAAPPNNFPVSSLRKPTASPLKLKKKKAALLDTTVAGKKIQLLSKSKDDLLQLQKVLVENQIKHEDEKHGLELEFMKKKT